MQHTTIGPERTQQQPGIKLIRSLQDLKEMVWSFDQTLPLYFDTETTGYAGSDLRTDFPVSLQFMQREMVYIVDVREMSKSARFKVGSWISDVFRCLLVGHNIKFDLEVLKIHFDVLPTKVWDTMIAEQVLYGLGLSDGRKSGVGFGLKDCAARRGIEVSKETRETFKNMHLTPAWREPFTQEQLEYMAQDVHVLPTIQADQISRLIQNANDGGRLGDCFHLEMETLPCLASVEVSGVPVDWDAWMQIIKEKEQEADALRYEVELELGEAIINARTRKFDERMGILHSWEDERDKFMNRMPLAWDELLDKHFVYITLDEDSEQAFFDLDTGECPKTWGKFKVAVRQAWTAKHPRPRTPEKLDDFVPNIGSGPQLLMAFKELGIEAKDTTEDTLEDLSEDHPIIGKLLQYRKAAKFVQSFGENLKNTASKLDGRLHPDYMQIGASSNRMSCTKPNFQQIPSRSVTGQRLRSCVKATPGWKILTADFGSQEMCIVADLSGDENMLRFFEEGQDLHSATARMMFGLSDDVDPKKYEISPGLSARVAAKTINFGLVYGLTAYGLAYQLNISPSSAEQLIEAWYKPYQGVKRYFDDRKDQIFRGEFYAETMHGWVRRLPVLPPEPAYPFYNPKDDAAFRNKKFREYQEQRRAWRKLKKRIENQLMNTPVQGTGAGVTKRALVNFSRRTASYNAKKVRVRVIALVHDELVAEVREEIAEEVAPILAGSMDDAMRFYLKRVKFPASDVHIADCWSK